MSRTSLQVWEVFLQPKIGAQFQHAGSVHAADKEMALQNARELYTRRQEGTCIWVVKSEDIVSSTPDDNESFFDLEINPKVGIADKPIADFFIKFLLEFDMLLGFVEKS